MNNEVKEILAYFEEYVKIIDMHDSEPMLNWKDLKIILDYITNLQKKLDFMIDRNDEKQDRINKVIEYIKHENFKRNILLGFSERKYVRDILNNVLEILGDKENE